MEDFVPVSDDSGGDHAEQADDRYNDLHRNGIVSLTFRISHHPRLYSTWEPRWNIANSYPTLDSAATGKAFH
jgi:hypothetical protein